ncbi:uncharacterized protein BO66DRAFT_133226 [Aspergillus aculeatinus CBS 121060]|uniref:Uncharacterized protein n=1 Tax=Aspergillus aculeatinus CBS 121060 TaxID=1448322 RepID=A0ACD1H3W0_9EURO|nr:hypothetical protein BO66DRAFT_133226 [Aspergillus aculeatinus CBS 121060]RAH68258.1 hypothetical protein BO66DRAFT_133226 [Aspergillus aculeatinus CBS 121060]
MVTARSRHGHGIYTVKGRLELGYFSATPGAFYSLFGHSLYYLLKQPVHATAFIRPFSKQSKHQKSQAPQSEVQIVIEGVNPSSQRKEENITTVTPPSDLPHTHSTPPSEQQQIYHAIAFLIIFGLTSFFL